IVRRDRALAHQHAELRDRGDVAHGFVIAMFVLTADESEVRKILERRESGGGERGTVPEEGESEEAVESGKSGEAGVGEWAVDEQMRGCGVGTHECVRNFTARPSFEQRDLMEQGETGVGNAASAAQDMQIALAGKRGD